MDLEEVIRVNLLICLCVVAGAFGCSRDQHDHPNLTTGKQLYDHHCAECHRKDGNGILFDSVPANILTNKNSQEIIVYLTTESNHERLMPVFETMPIAEATLITKHLRQLKFDYEKGNRSKPNPFLIEP